MLLCIFVHCQYFLKLKKLLTLNNNEMDKLTRVQILNKPVFILHCGITSGKGMNLTTLLPAANK